ncbi:MAG: OadG family protein [Bacteroidales bacterium]|nr:OadG family protein [Bacteroidales bacterium]
MNRIKNIVTVVSLLFAMAALPLQAQEEVATGDTVLTHFETNNPHSGIGVDVTNFVSVPACYVANANLFVAIDSIDNAVDILFRTEDGFDTLRHLSDVAQGRHDLVNILRPKSVGFADGYVLYLASSKKDSSYLAVLDLDGNLVNRLDFNCCSYAFQVFPDEVIVAGKNQQGYDIIVLDCKSGVAEMTTDGCQRYHYHKPKQADRIQESDPWGIGLTVVAVLVVFLALVCIALIIGGYGKAIMKIQDRRAQKSVSAKTVTDEVAAPHVSETSGEIYAAIATAIYLYDEELHDEEDTVITIQKVERAWTPWNAKFYNMNRYFQNR